MNEEEKTREDMSGMELLRRLADDVYQAPSLYCAVRDEGQEWWRARPNGERLADALRGIADKIEADRASASAARSAEDREAAERLDTLTTLAADGKPLIEGETVYNLSNGWPYVVASCSEDKQVQARYGGHGCPEWLIASRLTHARPEVLDADGEPVHVGDTVYIPEDGSPRKVSKIADDGRLYVEWIGWYRPHEVRITPPDSQEAIDSDALKNAGDYCNEHPEAAALRERGLSCKQAQIAHLLRRQRELDKGGE